MLNYFINKDGTVTCPVCKKFHKFQEINFMQKLSSYQPNEVSFECNEYFDLYVEFNTRTKNIERIQISFDDYLSIDIYRFSSVYHIDFNCSDESQLADKKSEYPISIFKLNEVIGSLMVEAKKSMYEKYLE
jgi:hypothetical protein